MNNFYPRTLLIPAVFVFGLFFVLPTLMGFGLAFTQYSVFQQALSFNGLDNFKYLFHHPQFLSALGNTIEFAIFSTILKTVIGLFLALLLVQPIRSGSLLKTVFYLPAILSPIIVAIMFQTVFRMDGFLNNIFAFLHLDFIRQDWMGQGKTVMGTIISMDVWRWSGFNMAIFIAGLQSIPDSFYEASSMDGATYWQKLIHIRLPLLMPALTINLTSNCIGGLNVFEQVLGLTGGGPGYSSQVIGTMVYQSFSQGYYGKASAMGMIQIIITLALGVFMYRYLSKKEVSY
jgi:raffinose/stachyose/melibiose transport system permease protein